MSAEFEMDVRIVRQYIRGEKNRVGDLWCAYIAEESLDRVAAALEAAQPTPEAE